ncbi:hypothetical protein O181_083589 [Austropuccinia psidii MF-1]|uniref:Uncharacterized protein n=1 Tax=Austropuccinia psidii MF-1 TaxID=1389203 RepID=A0A9Q3FRV8_9BASI|nr:hypothetical protein [Austropuccinia psidii MF-1]
MEDSDSESMGNAIRENNDKDQDQIEENIVEYQEGTQLEEGLPKQTTNNIFQAYTICKKFLVTPKRRMAYIDGTATKRTFSVGNTQHQLNIYSGAHF